MTVKIREVNGKIRLDIDYKGVRKYKTIGPTNDTNRAEAERQKAELEAGLRFLGEAVLKGPEQAKACPTFKQFAERWLKEISLTELKQATIQCYKTNLEHHLVPAFGLFRLNEISYEAVKAFLQAKRAATYQVERRKKFHEDQAPTHRAYSRDAIRLMRATLRAIFEEALTEHLVSENVAANRKLARIYATRKAPPQPYTLEELKRLESKFAEKYPDYYPFVMVMSRAGLRIGEAMALEWTDLDFEKGKIRVSKNKPAGRRLTTPKTERSNRLVDMRPELGRALKAFRVGRIARWLQKGETLPDVIFCRESGAYLDYGNFRKAWKRVHVAAELVRRRPHDLRHTFVSQLFMRRATLLYVAAQIGDNPQTVLKTYAHFIPEDAPEMAEEQVDQDEVKNQ